MTTAAYALLTFLFTDIEGSTRRWEADADAMRAALAAHDATLTDAVTAYDGGVFKHTGDGMCAVFTSPRAAVGAAMAAQRELDLPVRMGIATGEAEHRQGDYFGPVLNRAARIMAAGHGGQILLDGITAHLLSGIDLVDHGPRQLRDIAKPVWIYQAAAEGLRRAFPPLRSNGPAPGNLRPAPTPIIGRDREFRDLERALREHRLITLTGVGGVGKTRLALEVGTRASSMFRDGVWLVEFAAVSDAKAVPEAAAAVLGVLQRPGVSLAASIAAALDGQSKLLIFDNCEHILDAAAQLTEAILGRSDSVRILATSREGLQVPGERLMPVNPLPVTGSDSSAVALFLERARAVVPDFRPSSDPAAVQDVCRRLDGIPLALELAASRLVSMTVAELRDRLDDRFRVLTGKNRGLRHHQTLRRAVQWSHDLLSAAEREALKRCSVFAGGFDLKAAHAVLAADDEYTTQDRLEALVRKSLLVANTSMPTTRFSMLETIRRFAYEQFSSPAEIAEVRTAHARHFAFREQATLALWEGPRQREAYYYLDAELANLRAAFRWAVECDDLDCAISIAVVAGFLGGWIELHEPNTWAEEVLAQARSRDHPRLAQLYVAASECYRTGRVDDALRYTDIALELIDSGRYDPIHFDIETTALGGTFATAGLPERWLELCRRRIRPGSDTNPYAPASMAMALMTTGHVDEAASSAAGLLEMAEETDNPGAAAFALLAYGYCCRESNPLVAYQALLRGLDIARNSGNRMTESYIAVNLSTFVGVQAPRAATLDFLSLAINNFHDSGSYSHMVSPLGVLATRLVDMGRPEAAATIIGFAATAFSLVTFPEITATIERLRGELGVDVFESLTNAGALLSYGEVARYALDQIDIARALD
ncbi:cyclase [Mycobacterium sp. Soil538]|nr:cyclase [Mycobacterium sp. Soil538]